MMNIGVDVYAVNLAAESEEGESARSIIEFVWIDANSLAIHIEGRYCLQVVEVKDTTLNLVNDLGRLLWGGGECFYGDFARYEGNEIGGRVWLQEAVYGRRELAKSYLLPPHSVGDGLKFWEGNRNVVFTEVNCPGDYVEGGGWVWGCGGFLLSSGTSDEYRDSWVGGRHGGVSVVVGGAFERGWFHTKFRSRRLGIYWLMLL